MLHAMYAYLRSIPAAAASADASHIREYISAGLSGLDT